MKSRNLNNKEEKLARQVFYNTLPYHQIRIADDLGGGDRPWTDAIFAHVYTIHLGDAGYADATSKQGDIDKVFIHELTHVWQATHSRIRWSYMLKSLIGQAAGENFSTEPLHCWATQDCGVNAAYRYLPGKPWDSYDVEQQAHIVEDWYSGAKVPNYSTFRPMDRGSPLFRYIITIHTTPTPGPIVDKDVTDSILGGGKRR